MINSYSSYNTIFLTKIKYAVHGTLGRHMIENMNLQVLEDHLIEELIYKLTTEAIAQQLPPQFVTEYSEHYFAMDLPVNWWDHFKMDNEYKWFMRWRKWKINYKTVSQKSRNPVTIALRDHWVYPEANRVVHPQDFGKPILVVTWEDYK